LAELVGSGSLPPKTLVWSDGMAEWQPWEALPSKQAPSRGAAAAKATVAAAPTPVAHTADAPPDPDAELENLMGEISAIEAEVEKKKRRPGAADDAAAEPLPLRKESPPPEEKQFTDDDGTVYRWDSALRAFKPVDEPLEYTVEEMVFRPEEETIPVPKAGNLAEAKAAEEEAPLTGIKRQRAEAMQAEREKIARAKEAKKDEKPEGWFELKKNTSVYVSGLPSDVSVEEVKDAFGRCGIIKENDDRTPRIKLYQDKATGMLKGDGLVTFLKEPSVEIACTIMDGAPLRPNGPPMSVSVAQFEKKPDRQPSKKPGKKPNKKQVVNQEKRLGWEGFDDFKKPEEVTVILKHMFTLEEMQLNPNLREELEEDVASECSKLGAIERLRVFATNPEGVISVRFKFEDAAAECIKLMNGRFFAGRQIVAHMYDGVTNYNVKLKESEEEQAARLEAFTREIENS